MTSFANQVVDVLEGRDESCETFAQPPPPSAKMLENRASISSVDSSISLSYDAAPFTPRGSIAGVTDDESASRHDEKDGAVSGFDSGTETKRMKTGSGGSQTEGDHDEEPFEPPEPELAKRIVDQVEYYFSDENIVKDAFLLKHVRRNKEGYVSLKLIASFKRVKHIARDWRSVRAALETSTKLQINEAGTKLRRRDPLPSYDQTTPSRTVVAVNVPPHKATIESVAESFRACGEIALVRILRPGNPIPADVRPFYNKHPEIHDAVCALVEFVRTESAHNALNRDAGAEGSMRVLELNAPPPAKKKAALKKPFARGREADFSSSCPSGSETDDRHQLRTQRRSQPQPEAWSQRRWSRDSGSESAGSSFTRSRSNSGVYYMPDQRRSSSGWESSCDSFGSCRSRSNSGASIPEIFQMRRYSLPRKESACCCCELPRCESVAGRRYSLGKGSEDGYGPRPLSRCASGENCSDGPYRKESVPEYYALHRGGSSSSCERRPSLTRPADFAWSRSSSTSSTTDSGRRLSDSDGRIGLMRQRSFSNGGIVGHATDTILRLPRGPDGGRGFQRELIEYALPE